MYARFGQELYPRETIAAARLIAAQDDDPRPLTSRIAETLAHPSPQTRVRVANKLVQRLAAGVPSPPDYSGAKQDGGKQNGAERNGLGSAAPAAEAKRKPRAEPQDAGVTTFSCLLCNHADTQAQRDLVYYAAARADGLIAAIASDILYPYFIEDRIPIPYSEDEFIMANAGLLLAPEPIVTAGFVADYARRAWNFDSPRTVGLALRILRQAGILISAPLLGARGRVAAYTLAPHGMSLSALLWAFYGEFGQASLAPAFDQVERSHFARLFVVSPSVVRSLLWEAEKAGIAASWSPSGARRVALKVREPDALARLLLSGPAAK